MLSKCFLAVVLGCSVLSCTTKDSLERQDTQSKSLMNTSNDGEIFTYYFDPSISEVDTGITGTLIEKDGCLLLEAPTGGIFLTPIFPSGVSRWDKQENIVYIKNMKFIVGKQLTISGAMLDTQDKSEKERSYFKDQADITCLKDLSARLGTYIF